MQTLFSKALVASVAVSGLGLVAAPQASAATFDSLGFSDFFAGGTLTTDNFSATGFSSSFSPQDPPSFVSLQQDGVEPKGTVNAILFPALGIGTRTLEYTMTSVNPFKEVSAALIPNPSGSTIAELVKNIYTDQTKGTLLGTAITTQTGLDLVSNSYVFIDDFTSIFVEDKLLAV